MWELPGLRNWHKQETNKKLVWAGAWAGFMFCGFVKYVLH